MVYDHVLQLALKPVSKFFLPFPSLIYRLIKSQHPDIQMLKRSSISASQSQATSRRGTTATEPVNSLGLRAAVQLAVSILQAALDAGKCVLPLSHFLSFPAGLSVSISYLRIFN
ncbi:hypothetical protein AtEden1_Chr2g0226091 [Arabidopsis thaliana]